MLPGSKALTVSRRDAWAVSLLVAATAGALTAGFLLDAHDFLLHVLAETAALLVGAGLVGVFVRLHQERQRRQTTLLTLTAIWRQLAMMSDAAGMVLRFLKRDQMIPDNPPRPLFSVNLLLVAPGAAPAVEELKKISLWMREHLGLYRFGDPDILPPGAPTEHKSSVELLGKVEQHYLYLRDHVAPRLIFRSDNERLIGILYNLDRQHLEWQRMVHEFPDDVSHAGYATLTWTPAIMFFEALTELATYIAPPLGALDPSGTDPKRARELLSIVDSRIATVDIPTWSEETHHEENARSDTDTDIDG